MTAQRGIRLSIYKDKGQDFSNGGVSSYTDQVTLVEGPHGEQVKGPFEPTEEAPAVKIVKKSVGGRVSYSVQPVEAPGDGTPWMAGGTYVGTSDSRFSDLTGIYGALSFHDRTESWALYNALSRD